MNENVKEYSSVLEFMRNEKIKVDDVDSLLKEV